VSSQSTRSATPPRADLAFRVGIIGHRPNRLPKDKAVLDTLRTLLRSMLEEVKAEVSDYSGTRAAKILYSDKPPVLRAISSLAEGTDRIFAQQAINLGYQIVCPMPFWQQEFEKDFLPPHALEDNSRNQFRGLLRQAREAAGLTTFELDGERGAAGAAYGIASDIVLNQSDLLMAVWDGEKTNGSGGTFETLQKAVHYHVPVLWIDALAPHTWQLLRSQEDLGCLEGNSRCVPRVPYPVDPPHLQEFASEAVRRIVRQEITLHDPNSESHRATMAQSHADQYFRTTKPWINIAIVWKLFRNAVGSGTFQLPQLFIPNFEDQIRKEWPTHDDALVSTTTSDIGKKDTNGGRPPSMVEDWVNRVLRPHYAWSDKLGDLFADAYRSAYILTYLLAAIAVFVALLPVAMDWKSDGEIICVATEIGIMSCIVLLVMMGRTRRWHERWMECRLLAELIRQQRILIPLGGGRPFPRVPAYLGSYGNLTQTWIYWHMRALSRAAGTCEAKVTPGYALDSLNYIAKVVNGSTEGQLKFHKDMSVCSNNIADRLHLTSLALFALTIVGSMLHGILEYPASEHFLQWLHISLPGTFSRWLMLASATLPALGAALAGISNQGEFARVAKRSAAMADTFKQYAAQIAALRSGSDQVQNTIKLSQVIPLARNIAEIMVDEVADWRVVFIDRPYTVS
jgi:hypothetical protein